MQQISLPSSSSKQCRAYSPVINMCMWVRQNDDLWLICDWQAVEFINNLKAERSGKKIDFELLEGELADDVILV